jgi:hypothetical protein
MFRAAMKASQAVDLAKLAHALLAIGKGHV